MRDRFTQRNGRIRKRRDLDASGNHSEITLGHTTAPKWYRKHLRTQRRRAVKRALHVDWKEHKVPHIEVRDADWYW